VPTLDRRRAFQVELDAPIATGTGCGSSQGGKVHPLDVVILLPYNAIEISCGPSRHGQVRINLDRYRRGPAAQRAVGFISSLSGAIGPVRFAALPEATRTSKVNSQ
jgi:hypothetical protein